MNYEDFKAGKFAFEHDGTVEQLREAMKRNNLSGAGEFYWYSDDHFGFDCDNAKPTLPIIKVTEYLLQQSEKKKIYTEKDVLQFGIKLSSQPKEMIWTVHNLRQLLTNKKVDMIKQEEIKSEFPRQMMVWNNDESDPFEKEVVGMFEGQYMVKTRFGFFIGYSNAKEVEPENEFEKYTVLTEYILEMANSGKAPRNWTGFLSELNNILKNL